MCVCVYVYIPTKHQICHGHYLQLSLLNYFKWKNLDECNIVRFIDSFLLRDNRCALVFEMLDMTLRDFLFYQRDFIPLYLHEVRSVVQQVWIQYHQNTQHKELSVLVHSVNFITDL